MQFETVLLDRKGATTIISLNRPDVLNALNRPLIRETRAAFEAADADPETRVIVLKGEGRAFCTGDDLTEDFSDVTTTQGRLQTIERLQDVTRAILRTPKPVIAAVHGFALGAGCEWCINCDMRIAAEGTEFGFPEAKWGYSVTNAGTKLLPQLIGMGRAKQLIFSTDRIDAATAEQWGLVNRVVREDELTSAALDLAERISANSSLSLELSKRALNQGAHLDFEQVLANETRDAVLCAESAGNTDQVKQAFEDERERRREN